MDDVLFIALAASTRSTRRTGLYILLACTLHIYVHTYILVAKRHSARGDQIQIRSLSLNNRHVQHSTAYSSQ